MKSYTKKNSLASYACGVGRTVCLGPTVILELINYTVPHGFN